MEPKSHLLFLNLYLCLFPKDKVRVSSQQTKDPTLNPTENTGSRQIKLSSDETVQYLDRWPLKFIYQTPPLTGGWDTRDDIKA